MRVTENKQFISPWWWDFLPNWQRNNCIMVQDQVICCHGLFLQCAIPQDKNLSSSVEWLKVYTFVIDPSPVTEKHMWSLCKWGRRSQRLCWLISTGLMFRPFSFLFPLLLYQNCQLDMLDLHKLLITDMARWDVEHRGDERCKKDRDPCIMGLSVLNPLAQCPTLLCARMCVCVCKF